MKRKVIKIDDEKCNGCGICVPSCHEGAIRIVNGKAHLAADNLCDGLGACLKECPQGAITIEEREAEGYSEITALKNIMTQGKEAVEAHLKHLKDHGEHGYLNEALVFLSKGESMEKKESVAPSACGCPGSAARVFKREAPKEGAPSGRIPSELRQWPVQLRLLNPHAPFFQGADLLVSADCAAFAYGDFHRKFLKDKVLVMFCPKLDEDLEEYVSKLADVFATNDTPSVTVVKMEVPCCGGTLKIVEDAVRRSGKTVIIKEYTLSLDGEIL